MSDRSRYHDCGGVAAIVQTLDGTRRERERRETRAARPGTSACRSSSRRCPSRRSRRGMPPSEVTVSTTSKRVGVLQTRRAARCRSRRPSTSPRARPRRGARRDARAGRRAGAADRAAVPTPPRRGRRRAAAPRHLAHAVAEHAVGADDRGVARLEQVDEAGFHARRARAAHRQRERVLGAEHGAQPLHRLVHDREELGIHVPEQRATERGGGLGVRVRRSRAEQQTIE